MDTQDPLDYHIPDYPMTSREIAEHTGKTHANVLRDIRRLAEALGEDLSEWEASYVDASGRQQLEYHLDGLHTATLLSGYMSVVERFKAALQWRELKRRGVAHIH